jgi:hypothetical protein
MDTLGGNFKMGAVPSQVAGDGKSDLNSQVVPPVTCPECLGHGEGLTREDAVEEGSLVIEGGEGQRSTPFRLWGATEGSRAGEVPLYYM